ncbi:MAG TPA: MarR family transcriptional regulator [Acidimicrobiaceae bacterium]|nr:MarR family transcriptional regulator [Acidimicrobiaceae bacterium]
MTTTPSPTTRIQRDKAPGGSATAKSAAARRDAVLDRLEQSLTEVGRAMLRMGIPPEALAEGEHVDRSGYWAMVRLDEVRGGVRLSDLASSLELDLSTVSRQVRNLVEAGLVDRDADPDDGRAALLTLSARGRDVLDAVRAARRQVLGQTLCGWTATDRDALVRALGRLADDLHLGTER